jgi:hypothetical protein
MVIVDFIYYLLFIFLFFYFFIFLNANGCRYIDKKGVYKSTRPSCPSPKEGREKESITKCQKWKD